MSTITMSVVSIEDRSLPLRQHLYTRLGQFQADCDQQINDLRYALAARIDELFEKLSDELLQIQQEQQPPPPSKSELHDEPQRQRQQPKSESDETLAEAVDYDDLIDYVGCSDDDEEEDAMLFDDADDGDYDDDEEMSDGEEDATTMTDAAVESHTLAELQPGDGESSVQAIESECTTAGGDAAVDAVSEASATDSTPTVRRRRASVGRQPAASKPVYQCEICADIVGDRYTLQLHQLSAHGHSARFVFWSIGVFVIGILKLVSWSGADESAKGVLVSIRDSRIYSRVFWSNYPVDIPVHCIKI